MPRLVYLVLLVGALAACDTASEPPGCPSPFEVSIRPGEVAMTRKSSLEIGYHCSPVLLGQAAFLNETVVLETKLDTLRFSFAAHGGLHHVEYSRGDPQWNIVRLLTGSFDRGDGRGRFEIVVGNGSLFPVRDTLRGRFYVAVPGSLHSAAAGRGAGSSAWSVLLLGAPLMSGV